MEEERERERGRERGKEGWGGRRKEGEEMEWLTSLRIAELRRVEGVASCFGTICLRTTDCVVSSWWLMRLTLHDLIPCTAHGEVCLKIILGIQKVQ
jgi:hypothetical protein